MRTEQSVAKEPMAGDVVCPIIRDKFAVTAQAQPLTVEAVVGNLVAVSSQSEAEVGWIKRSNWMKPNALIVGWRVITIVQEA